MARDKQAILLELLVLRCKRGEKQSFDQLICQWEGRLLYYVRRLVATEEDAWDVLQQTWIKVWKGIKMLDDPERLPTWLYQIARRTAASHWLAHREVLTLHFMDDLSLEQMAEVLAVPLGTVKSRLCYAKRALRAILEHEEGSP